MTETSGGRLAWRMLTAATFSRSKGDVGKLHCLPPSFRLGLCPDDGAEAARRGRFASIGALPPHRAVARNGELKVRPLPVAEAARLR